MRGSGMDGSACAKSGKRAKRDAQARGESRVVHTDASMVRRASTGTAKPLWDFSAPAKAIRDGNRCRSRAVEAPLHALFDAGWLWWPEFLTVTSMDP